jgi:hypothetical protein
MQQHGLRMLPSMDGKTLGRFAAALAALTPGETPGGEG